MNLQTTFYVLGIITMGVALILLIALVTAVFVIRAKITAIHDTIEQKLSLATNLASSSSDIFKSVKKVVTKSK